MNRPPTIGHYRPANPSAARRERALTQLLYVSLTGFLLLLWAVNGDAAVRLDLAVHAWVCTHRTALLTQIARSVTWLGSTMALTVATLGATAALLRVRGRKAALDPAIAGILVLATMNLVKYLLDRPRPLLADQLVAMTDPSFPSGHTSGITALVTVLALHTLGSGPTRSRRAALAVAYGIVIVTVAWSRLYLGVHYLSDVAAGFCLGVTCALAARALPLIRADN